MDRWLPYIRQKIPSYRQEIFNLSTNYIYIILITLRLFRNALKTTTIFEIHEWRWQLYYIVKCEVYNIVIVYNIQPKSSWLKESNKLLHLLQQKIQELPIIIELLNCLDVLLLKYSWVYNYTFYPPCLCVLVWLLKCRQNIY